MHFDLIMQPDGILQGFDWFVLIGLTLATMFFGLWFTRSVAENKQNGFFTADHSLSWWAVGISNSATYQSGLGAFVMLIFMFGLAGNWLWWAQWIIWMPLVALIWARMWRRLQIVTTAQLISLRYFGTPAVWARKVYAASMFILAVTLIAYITGFFAKTVYPLLPLSETTILLIFGGVTVVYTMFGGLMGSVMVAVAQMVLMIAGSMVFLWLIIPQMGGWEAILAQVSDVRPDALSLSPISSATPWATLVMFIVLGLFFPGSPTAGEGMTAQRFMAARSERHAVGGQLFNAFIALSLRVIPLVGLGIVAMAIFWSSELTATYGKMPTGMKMLDDPAYAWGTLIVMSHEHLPRGFVGLLVATEVAAFMSTLSALINWGASFLVNDFYKELRPLRTEREELWINRLVSLVMFVFAAGVAILWVDKMAQWFLFINSVVIIFWLPLTYYRFFWPRFNVWGELAASLLGIPLAIIVWFGLLGLPAFKDKPFWMGSGLLLVMAISITTIIPLITRPEPHETLNNFYQLCRPVFGWKKYRADVHKISMDPPISRLLFDCILGILTCLGMVFTTHAMFVERWGVLSLSIIIMIIFGSWLLKRCMSDNMCSRKDIPLEIDTNTEETITLSNKY